MSNIINEFIELAQIDAPSRNERAIADVLIEKLKALGCTVCEDDAAAKVEGNTGNVIGYFPGDPDETVALCAHMDRVENGINIHPRIEGDRIVSDGTTILAADDLGGVAAILEGLRRVRKSNQKHPSVEVVFTVCEELGLKGAKNMDFSKLKAKTGYVLDASGDFGAIAKKTPNKTEFTIEYFGKTAHGAMCPEKGVNAIMAAVNSLSGLNYGRITDEIVFNIGCIDGPMKSGICDYVIVYGTAWSFDSKDTEQQMENLRLQIDTRLKDSKATYKISINEKTSYKGYNLSEDDPVIRRAFHAISQTGVKPVIRADRVGVDANIFNMHGIRTVALTGGYNEPHTKSEYIRIDDLEHSAQMIEQLLLTYYNF